MGELTDKTKGYANKTAGAVKEAVGHATGNASLENRGKAQQVKGDAQTLAGDIKGAFGDKV